MAISQDLKPSVQNIEDKKHFCFTIKQSRFIAKRLEKGLFQDSIIRKLFEGTSRLVGVMCGSEGERISHVCLSFLFLVGREPSRAWSMGVSE